MQNRNRLLRFFKLLYLKLFRIHGSPQKVALGFGLGACLGMMPGTGPIASLVLASILHINRASALLGSLLTNTWLSIATFLLAVKTGAFLTQTNYLTVQRHWQECLKDFHWANLLKLPVLNFIFPVILGYVIISLLTGLLAYLISWFILINFRKKV